jgi:hypothetical protein
LFGSQSVVSMPLRLHPAYIPHVVLIAFIVLASAAGAAIQLAGWIVRL